MLTTKEILKGIGEGYIGIAMDDDGDWYKYTKKPYTKEHSWFCEGEDYERIEGMEIDFKGDWKDSWTEK